MHIVLNFICVAIPDIIYTQIGYGSFQKIYPAIL
jgi:hypothetical protein